MSSSIPAASASSSRNNTASQKRVLIVVTNEAFIPSSREHVNIAQADVSQLNFLEAPQQSATSPINKNYTGVDIYELAHIWQTLRQQLNCEIDFASPRGGPTAADPFSVERMRKDEKLRKSVNDDRELIDALGHTYPLEWIKPENYNCIVIPGCRGAMFDLPESRQLENIIAQAYEKNQALICCIGHGTSALINVKKLNSSEYLVKNRKVTCFSDREEKEMGMDRLLPFMIEDRLKERGAKLEIVEPNKAKVVVDERIITAQNSQSIKEFIQRISENLKQAQLAN